MDDAETKPHRTLRRQSRENPGYRRSSLGTSWFFSDFDFLYDDTILFPFDRKDLVPLYVKFGVSWKIGFPQEMLAIPVLQAILCHWALWITAISIAVELQTLNHQMLAVSKWGYLSVIGVGSYYFAAERLQLSSHAINPELRSIK